ILEAHPEFQNSPEDLTRIFVRSTNNTQVPLSEIGRFETSNTPLVIEHQGQFPVVTLSFNLAPGVSLGEAVDVIHTAEQQIGFPESIQASFQGTAAAFQNSLANQPMLILAALVTVYIVL